MRIIIELEEGLCNTDTSRRVKEAGEWLVDKHLHLGLAIAIHKYSISDKIGITLISEEADDINRHCVNKRGKVKRKATRPKRKPKDM